MAATLLTLIYLVSTANSAACLPAYTCFEAEKSATNSALDQSYKMVCDADGTVRKEVYAGVLDCSGTPLHARETTDSMNEPDQTSSSGTGTINIQYLQGTNCPMSDASNSCSEYMVLKHRGKRGDMFADIGDNCGNYIGNEQTFVHYSSIVIPVGCVSVGSTGGSMLYHCNAQKWGYTYYNASDCSGKMWTAQTDEYTVDTCDHFEEYTHCSNSSQTTGCNNDPNAVLQEFWSWYDLECCYTERLKRCFGTAYVGNASQPTPRPTGPGLYGTTTTQLPTSESRREACVFYGVMAVLLLYSIA